MVPSRWAKVVAGAGSVRSSAGTMACTEVMEPFRVELIRPAARPSPPPGWAGSLRRRASCPAARKPGTGLHKAENIIDKQQDILALDPGNTGGSQARQPDPHPGSRGSFIWPKINTVLFETPTRSSQVESLPSRSVHRPRQRRNSHHVRMRCCG